MECIFFIVLFFINSIIVWCPTQSFMTVEGSSNIVHRICPGLYLERVKGTVSGP